MDLDLPDDELREIGDSLHLELDTDAIDTDERITSTSASVVRQIVETTSGLVDILDNTIDDDWTDP